MFELLVGKPQVALAFQGSGGDHALFHLLVTMVDPPDFTRGNPVIETYPVFYPNRCCAWVSVGEAGSNAGIPQDGAEFWVRHGVAISGGVKIDKAVELTGYPFHGAFYGHLPLLA